jgi:L-xylulokinase
MGKYVMGVDNGGTVTKACLYDAEGNLLGTASVKVPTLTPHPLWTERDTEELWQANIGAIRQCIAAAGVDASEVAGLALTGHGNGMYLSRADGSAPWNGIISTDGRAQSYVDAWHARPDFDERARRKTLSSVWAGQPVALLAWMDEHHPEVFDDTAYVFMAKDYVRFRLTGEAAFEETDASFVGVMDITRRVYDRDLLDFFGVGRWIDKLPPQVPSTAIAARLTAEAAALTGLPEGTPVAGGCADIAASALASGVVSPDKLAVVTGTWSINEYVTTEPSPDSAPFLTAVYPVPGTWLVLEASPNGVSNLEWYLRSVLKPLLARFGAEPGDGDVFAVCEQMIGEIEPSLDDPFFVPFINGSGVVPDGRAAFVGLLTLHDVRHLVRAVYEGVVLSHLYDVRRLRGYATLADTATFTGGAANSEVWTRMFADAIGSPLQVVDAPEAGTLGVAIMAAVAVGLWPDVVTAVAHMTREPRLVVTPDPERTAFWAQRYDRFAAYLETQR